MSGGNSDPGRTVTSKVLAILDAFGPADPRLTLTELGQRTNLPLATVHRLCAELVEWGGLERDERGAYRIGMRLWEVGSLTPERSGLREIAIPFMENLYEATHENVQLAVLADRDALFVEKISGPQSVPIVTRVGGRLPLHATGAGKALLAYGPPSLLEALIARGLPQLTPFTITDPDVLRRCMDEVRRNGFAFTRDEMTLGSVSVAAPIFGPDDTAIAAISLVVRSATADIGRLALGVRTAAVGVSRRVAEAWDGTWPSPGDDRHERSLSFTV
jgi:DNA-binding IclR family transcriptional regulator